MGEHAEQYTDDNLTPEAEEMQEWQEWEESQVQPRRRKTMSTPAIRQPRPTASSSPIATKTFSLSDIVSKSKPQPTRYAFYADGGFGKTSLASYFPSPIFIMAKEETGLLPLIEANLIPETPHFPEMQSWSELLAAIDVLLHDEHAFKTLVIDTANGVERMCFEHVCERDFKGDWGKSGFASYQTGVEVSLADWRMFLNKLDQLRMLRGMTIVLLMHMSIRTFKNPSGADYDQYVPEMKEKTWSLTRGWLDCIMFGKFEVIVSDGSKELSAGKKGKAAETSTRMLYTNSDNPTFHAKNRMGLPDEIALTGEDAKDAFKSFSDAVRKARGTKKQEEATNG